MVANYEPEAQSPRREIFFWCWYAGSILMLICGIVDRWGSKISYILLCMYMGQLIKTGQGILTLHY